MIDNHKLIELSLNQRLHEYAQIFINALLFSQNGAEELVGKIFRRSGYDTTVTSYSHRGLGESLLMDRSNIVSEELFRDYLIYRIPLHSWLEYLRIDTPDRCNIVRALYGESFVRIVGNEARFKAAASPEYNEAVGWLEFIVLMERCYIQVFSPPVSHQDSIRANLGILPFSGNSLKDTFQYSLLGAVKESQWKVNTIIYATQMQSLGQALKALFEKLSGSLDDQSDNKKLRAPVEEVIKAIEQASSDKTSPFRDILPLLNYMKISINIVKLVLSPSTFGTHGERTLISIETFIMAVKLIDYGNTIFRNIKKVALGDSISEICLVEWLQEITLSDSICGDYESKELLQYRRHIAAKDVLMDDEWKILNKIQVTDDNEGFLFSHLSWNTKVVPKAVGSFHSYWDMGKEEGSNRNSSDNSY